MVGADRGPCHRARPDVSVAVGANDETIGPDAPHARAASGQDRRAARHNTCEPPAYYCRMGRTPPGSSAGAEDQSITGIAPAFAAGSTRYHRWLYAGASGPIAKTAKQDRHNSA